MRAKISIALCSYNGEKYIKEQLLSILKQTREPDEIIIVDDNSFDNTVAIINEVLEGFKIRWELIINPQNLGVTKNFEKAISLCKGDIIFTCD